jgi:predicted O-linked N-acetylglucosamine transferase (SPINDLY family)
MKGHRLYALANKPAPVMAHWMGYPFTSGLPAFDYHIGDRWMMPEPNAKVQFTEQLAYLTGSLFNYRPKAHIPEVNTLPALHNGFITFGSLNNLLKLNRSVVSVWSQILLSIPDSRLILQTQLLADQGVAGRVRGLFEAFGVDMQRLDFRPASTQYLKTYQEIDIALDTFPYNGATTSCEALWMGVPVLTLAGNSSVSRMGVSILSAAGLTDWITNTVSEYIHLAQQHSRSPDNLARLRSELRQRIKDSQLCDEEGFALDFARCIKQMISQKNES